MNESHWEYDYIHMEVFSGTMPICGPYIIGEWSERKSQRS